MNVMRTIRVFLVLFVLVVAVRSIAFGAGTARTNGAELTLRLVHKPQK